MEGEGVEGVRSEEVVRVQQNAQLFSIEFSKGFCNSIQYIYYNCIMCSEVELSIHLCGWWMRNRITDFPAVA